MLYNRDPLVWWVHFGEILPSLAVCDQCEDFRAGICSGKGIPSKCIQMGILNRGSEAPETIKELEREPSSALR